jgi:hypothetical protein
MQEYRGGRSQFGIMMTDTRRSLDSITAPVLRRSASVVVLQGFHRFAKDRYETQAYTGVIRVRGSESAIALTQRSSVHLFQRPDAEMRYDPTRTSLQGGVAAVSIHKIAGRVRFSSNARYSSTGQEANDLGFVVLVNDMSLRNQVSLQSLKPSPYYRRFFGYVSNETHWTTNGTPSGASVTMHGSAELRNFWSTAFTLSTYDLGGARCVSCARGGPALRQSPERLATFYIGGDNRKVVSPTLTLGASQGDDGNSYSSNISLGAEIRVASRFSMSLAGGWEGRTDDQQWVANFGALLSDTTHYTFGRLALNTTSITARANWTATPTLSLQLYAQPFLSSGTFADWRELTRATAHTYADRYRPYGDGHVPEAFSVRQFNSNAVVRWEYRPGSILFFVWQQGRDSRANNGDFQLARDYRDLFRSHPNNTLLIKASYWFNL